MFLSELSEGEVDGLLNYYTIDCIYDDQWQDTSIITTASTIPIIQYILGCISTSLSMYIYLCLDYSMTNLFAKILAVPYSS
ncbi:MAG: hypothetical protein M3162_05860 [Thermoproteota archaeon]|nr:hypothetical protein [Thermoproteota archaeon]